MSWAPQPIQVSLLPDFYAQKSNGSVLPKEQRSVHPLGARSIIAAQDELTRSASDTWDSSRPIIVWASITRTNGFQYKLVKQNKTIKSDLYPNGVPTAVVGASLHAYGLAVDVNTSETMKRINEAGIDLSFEEFRQFLAGHGMLGIKSEAWHFNLMLRPQYYELADWKLRDTLYSSNWTDLSDEQKTTLLTLAGCKSSTLSDMTTEFQSKYSESLQVDGVCGPKTCRAAYVEWAHNNFYYVDVAPEQ